MAKTSLIHQVIKTTQPLGPVRTSRKAQTSQKVEFPGLFSPGFIFTA
jgi:hypothetical protein